MIFRQALPAGVFPSEWRKGNIVLIHKKSNKQNIRNYLPVSLIPICGKIFERLILTKCLTIFMLINLLAQVFNPVIPVLINYYQLPTKFIHLLIMD